MICQVIVILDKIGHEFGPFSKEIKNELNALDTELVGNLIKQLKSHHIFEETNIILTSDHGKINNYQITIR